jgi:hypothetical protein
MLVHNVVAMKRRPYLQKPIKLHGAKTLFYKYTSLPVKTKFWRGKIKTSNTRNALAAFDLFAAVVACF